MNFAKKKIIVDECNTGERDLERGLNQPVVLNFMSHSASNSPTTSAPRPSLVLSQSSKALLGSNSSKSLKASNSSKALLISNSNKSLVSTSGKRLEPSKKYVRQVTGRLNDTELHLAAQRGDNDVIKDILSEIDAQMMRTTSSVDFDAEVSLSLAFFKT